VSDAVAAATAVCIRSTLARTVLIEQVLSERERLIVQMTRLPRHCEPEFKPARMPRRDLRGDAHRTARHERAARRLGAVQLDRTEAVPSSDVATHTVRAAVRADERVRLAAANDAIEAVGIGLAGCKPSRMMELAGASVGVAGLRQRGRIHFQSTATRVRISGRCTTTMPCQWVQWSGRSFRY
jgi:hypothetical protein